MLKASLSGAWNWCIVTRTGGNEMNELKNNLNKEAEKLMEEEKKIHAFLRWAISSGPLTARFFCIYWMTGTTTHTVVQPEV